jgi:tetratricopeptide (TPR) repeat protein
MRTFRLIFLLVACTAHAQYVGSLACRGCHSAKFESQSKTGHAKALAPAAPGAQGQWAFGAGAKATTWVSQKGEDTLVEHGLSYYTATKKMGLTPGHDSPVDAVYRMFDSVGTALRCFRCHSTGPVKLSDSYKVEPSEPGIRCEACHGPGAAHVKATGAAGTIGNPKKLRTAELNELCGVCHRQASELDDDTDWGNAWNVRHQPSYLHRAACFRNSNGALSCVTCHNPHEPLQTTKVSYNAKCIACHKAVTHKAAVAARACVDCHMPQVTTSKALKFTNHWIGIYEQKGNPLAPSRRAVKVLRAAPAARSGSAYANPSDPSTLVPIYEKALGLREKEFGADHPRVARSASELGQFLKETGKVASAEGPLRRALSIDAARSDPVVDADRENLAVTLEAQGKQEEAIGFYRQAAAGRDLMVSARSFAALARIDQKNADVYLRNAVTAVESASGKPDRRVAVLLHELALALRAKGNDRAAEPELRRALIIQDSLTKPDHHVTVAVLNTLGNLLEGAGQLGEAEQLERRALRLAEEKFGPESSELSMTCTNLADVLWNRKDYIGAAQLFRRAILADTAMYGADRPETAANVANLGVLLREAGDKTGEVLLRQALAVYEKTLGPDSEQARFVRQHLSPR